MPSQVLATPLLREDAKQCGCKTEHETDEPERVDCDDVGRYLDRVGIR